MAEKIVILSAFHDYRTAKRASIQQVADGFVRTGHEVSFVSTRFSRLSRYTGDSRLPLWDRANRVEEVNGVRCYLWRTTAHPFASHSRLLNTAMNVLYPLYALMADRTVSAMLRSADYVLIESSVAAVFLRYIHRMNPRAKIIYYATDRLDTVGAHPFIQRRLVKDAKLISHVCLRSPRMAEDFAWARDRLYRAEFGIDTEQFSRIGPSPYTDSTVAVTVGSMLFDQDVFVRGAPLLPEVQFHVIGCGTTFNAPPNVTVHNEMRFADMLPYVKHATVGIAPYRPAPGSEYLAESSLKIAQYEYLGLPVVCPDFVVGDSTERLGYHPGDPASFASAMRRAIGLAGSTKPRQFLTWDEVAQRVLHPEDFPEIKLSA